MKDGSSGNTAQLLGMNGSLTSHLSYDLPDWGGLRDNDQRRNDDG
jgi:hypothetical protein